MQIIYSAVVKVIRAEGYSILWDYGAYNITDHTYRCNITVGCVCISCDRGGAFRDGCFKQDVTSCCPCGQTR